MQGELNVLLDEIAEKKKAAQNKKGCYRKNRTKLLPRTLCEDIQRKGWGRHKRARRGRRCKKEKEEEEESVQGMQWSS